MRCVATASSSSDFEKAWKVIQNFKRTRSYANPYARQLCMRHFAREEGKIAHRWKKTFPEKILIRDMYKETIKSNTKFKTPTIFFNIETSK